MSEGPGLWSADERGSPLPPPPSPLLSGLAAVVVRNSSVLEEELNLLINRSEAANNQRVVLNRRLNDIEELNMQVCLSPWQLSLRVSPVSVVLSPWQLSLHVSPVSVSVEPGVQSSGVPPPNRQTIFSSRPWCPWRPPRQSWLGCKADCLSWACRWRRTSVGWHRRQPGLSGPDSCLCKPTR